MGAICAELVYALMRLISNPFQIPETFVGYLTSPYLMLMVGLCLAGIAVLARRGQVLPLVRAGWDAGGDAALQSRVWWGGCRPDR